jgi:hypothetical protein
MANVKISELPVVTSVASSDVLPVVASTTTSKLTMTNLANSMPQVSSSISASYAVTASYSQNANLLEGKDSTIFATTGSNNFDGNQTITGSLVANDLAIKSNLYPNGGFVVGSGLVASYLTMGKYGQFAQLNMEVAGDAGLNNFPNFTFYSPTDGFTFRVPSSKNLQITGSVSITGSLNPRNFVVLNQVSQSLDFANDAAAASGGVPLGGLYRSGSFIVIRLV